MAMTMTQKILAAHAGLPEVKAGQLIEANLDLVLGNDVTAPPALDIFRSIGAADVFDRSKVVLVPDHFTPNKDIKSAENCAAMRRFARDSELVHYYEQGEAGMGVAWSLPATPSSAPIHIPAPTVPSGLSPLASAAPTWLVPW